jgi:hypothetical protein
MAGVKGLEGVTTPRNRRSWRCPVLPDPAPWAAWPGLARTANAAGVVPVVSEDQWQTLQTPEKTRRAA